MTTIARSSKKIVADGNHRGLSPLARGRRKVRKLISFSQHQ